MAKTEVSRHRRALADLRNEVADVRNRLHVADDQIASLGRINAETQRRLDMRNAELELHEGAIGRLVSMNEKLRRDLDEAVSMSAALIPALHRLTKNLRITNKSTFDAACAIQENGSAHESKA